MDYVVVGAGMIGSSAAKYICEKSKELGMNVKVAVIGVEEAGGENSLYGAWHDEGRITRLEIFFRRGKYILPSKIDRQE